MSFVVPILDTHIHLYPLSEASTLAWNTPDGPLWGQRSIAEYRKATASSFDILSGFIFVETDRKINRNTASSSSSTSSSLDAEAEALSDPAAWEHPLSEVRFFARLASGKPRDGEGHDAKDVSLCQGMVPWAPVPAGAEVLGRYLERVREACGPADGNGDGDEAASSSTWGKVRGVRYLLQDKPDGTMLTPKFVEGVRALGSRGLVFDLGVDLHRRGTKQLDEAVELIKRAHEGRGIKEKTVFVLNHLCKPDLTMLKPSDDTTSQHNTDPTFAAWRDAMFTLAAADNVYMKLSGCLSEMTPELANAHPHAIFDAISPWLAIIAAAFGPSRIMFGSDWPVCTVGIEGEQEAWDKWRLVVERLCLASQWDEAETKMVFFGTGRRAYGIDGAREVKGRGRGAV